MTKARDLMTTPVETVKASASLMDAAAKLARHNVGALPVCETGTIIAMVTDRDIVISALARGLDPRTTTVCEISSRRLITVNIEDDVEVVAAALADNRIRRVPVLEHGRVVGMISQADIARGYSAEVAGGMLAEISSADEPPAKPVRKPVPQTLTA